MKRVYTTKDFSECNLEDIEVILERAYKNGWKKESKFLDCIEIQKESMEHKRLLTPLRFNLIEMVKAEDENGGVLIEDLYKKLEGFHTREEINKEIMRLLEDGMIFEPKVNKLRWLG